MIEQPKRGDGEDAWRVYAGQLRQTLADANRDASSSRVRAKEAIEKRGKAERELAELQERYNGLHRAKLRDGIMLDELERELDAGDYPAATHRLAVRRRRIEKAAEKWDAR